MSQFIGLILPVISLQTTLGVSNVSKVGLIFHNLFQPRWLYEEAQSEFELSHVRDAMRQIFLSSFESSWKMEQNKIVNLHHGETFQDVTKKFSFSNTF